LSPNSRTDAVATLITYFFFIKFVLINNTGRDIAEIAENTAWVSLLCGRHKWRHSHDWISQIYSVQLFFDCIWWSIKFYAFWWFTSFEPIVKLLIKSKKNLIYDVNSNANSFFIFWTKNYFCPHVSILPNLLISPKFFGKKLSAILPPPCTKPKDLTGSTRKNSIADNKSIWNHK
jgi:hypothetical protein